MVFNIAHKANWKDKKDQKEKIIKYNNQKENAKRIKHQYHVGKKLLMQRNDSARKLECPYDGPYEITEVFTNGTVAIQKGIVNECVYIRCIFLYQEASALCVRTYRTSSSQYGSIIPPCGITEIQSFTPILSDQSQFEIPLLMLAFDSFIKVLDHLQQRIEYSSPYHWIFA